MNLRRRTLLRTLGVGFVAGVAGCTGSSGPDCETVADLGLPERETETFTVEEGQYVSISVENNFGARTHAVLRNPDGETMFSEGVQDAGTWRVFDSGSEAEVVTDSAGEWTVVYTPADDRPKTSGDVTVEVCTPGDASA